MNNIDEDRNVCNLHFEVEVTINRPVGQVWNQFLDFGSWVTTHVIEEVSEVRRNLGAIMRVGGTPEEVEGYPLAHHHYCKVVGFVPQQQYVLKTYSEKGGSWGMEITAFDDTRFVAVGSKTKVTFSFYGEFKGAAVADDDTASAGMDGSRDGMAKNLQNLKRIVESN